MRNNRQRFVSTKCLLLTCLCIVLSASSVYSSDTLTIARESKTRYVVVQADQATDSERLAIRESLNRFAGNRRKAADRLGISERTLYRKIKLYDM